MVDKVNKVKKGNFIELKYTGYSNGVVFDSNIEEDLKKLDEKAEVKKIVVIVGEGMVVPGLDKDLEGREVGKDYEVEVKAKDGFGERDRKLIKIIPLKAFTDKDVDPRPGMTLALDQSVVKIIAVSGARVTTDFNNLLAGRDLTYKYKIVRVVTDDKERVTSLFEGLFRFVPEFDVSGGKVIVKGPKAMEEFVKGFKEKFKELTKLELEFLEKKEDKKDDKEKSKSNEKKTDKKAQ